ncbi:glycerate kinase [Alicyclobacillus pomorum]|uniref:glycerate kinase n=1 Tax=Alicyclobacillus pomorum TaxID=204470 RepID=UPI0003FB54BD|nr:glycerate kinase [Alicyclobacillus pomorum]
MKVVISPDSYKGSLSAQDAAASIAKGVKRACPDAELDLLPIADGGEGTVDCLLAAVGGQKVWVKVPDPLGRTIDGFYGLLPDGTAVIEVAAAAGLGLIAENEREVMRENTAGVGELIRHALDHGRTSFVIGLGGSATNDAGIGMLYSLGARFYDASGHELTPTPAGCRNLAHVDVTNLHPALANARIRVACDVSNPLCGPTGATAVYGPQKGVTTEMIPVLDGILAQFARVVEHDVGISIKDTPGAGAAGGLGAASVGVLQAELVRGIDLVLDITSFDQRVSDADFVMTGEGRTDVQTFHGKVVFGVAVRAKAHGVPVFCLSGCVTEDAASLYQHGITVLLSIAPGPISLAESMQSTKAYLTRVAEAATRAFLAGRLSQRA